VIQPPEPAITPPGLNTISRKRPVQLVRITWEVNFYIIQLYVLVFRSVRNSEIFDQKRKVCFVLQFYVHMKYMLEILHKLELYIIR
jgi:hypothetical protein